MKEAWVFDPDTGAMCEVFKAPRDAKGGLPHRRMTDKDRAQAKAGRGVAGLWSGPGNSYFDNSRRLRTVDPSEYEASLGRARWHTPLRENGKGRVIQ